jgi:type II secretory ATPase GspE/PulE/Tfp pilus assembly ATPase PilB-like protein
LNTGYKGRIAVYEILTPTEEFRKCLIDGASEQQLKETAQKSGMQTLWEAGIRKALAGETTFQEVRRTLPPPDRS